MKARGGLSAVLAMAAMAMAPASAGSQVDVGPVLAEPRRMVAHRWGPWYMGKRPSQKKRRKLARRVA